MEIKIKGKSYSSLYDFWEKNKTDDSFTYLGWVRKIIKGADWEDSLHRKRKKGLRYINFEGKVYKDKQALYNAIKFQGCRSYQSWLWFIKKGKDYREALKKSKKPISVDGQLFKNLHEIYQAYKDKYCINHYCSLVYQVRVKGNAEKALDHFAYTSGKSVCQICSNRKVSWEYKDFEGEHYSLCKKHFDKGIDGYSDSIAADYGVPSDEFLTTCIEDFRNGHKPDFWR